MLWVVTLIKGYGLVCLEIWKDTGLLRMSSTLQTRFTSRRGNRLAPATV